MQFKFFNIPVNDIENAGEELNKFLRSHRVLEVWHQLANNNNGVAWHFSVKYLDSPKSLQQEKKQNDRIDYREVLDEETFTKYSCLREGRKAIAAEDGLPVYAVFTNEELANVARLPEINENSLTTVNGIGHKKAERFGKRLVAFYSDNSKKGIVNPLLNEPK